MHHNNINPNALDLCEEEKKNERNGDSVKVEGVCADPFVNLARPTPWVSLGGFRRGSSLSGAGFRQIG
jgi:hypothetical protein